ncbi:MULTISPECIES: threonine-phosphate decarboxylase CobD [Vagococcus]|uniref:threonine-phosphate decarboxylase n=1 Tax=Vagococcus fluvialis bH819 TaxID=1255619 RepID=A0A1X6WPG4_9ENTE|nr:MULTISPECIES: threonine-phosphate decarboxylase CobD [Vagococcus]SLM86221.1 L-threonine 3-O-phosphate decarboxylase [Vagococcus fluvialis bH819]HCM89687.1 threonine-phosphate decarboxylase [Vagococcus sp.]
MVGTHGGNIKELTELYQLSEKKIVDFSANINPLGVSKRLKAELYNNFDQILHYPDLRYKNLKHDIANYHKLNENYVFLGNGAAEVIYGLASVLEVEKLLVLAPTFSEYEDAFAHKLTGIYYFEIESSAFEVNINELILAVEKNNVDTICLCNPNNPTGKIVKKNEMKQLLAYCQAKKIRLIVDEAFMDFLPQEESLDTEIVANKNLFIVRSLTKIFAIPGLRLGYLLTSNQEVMLELNKRAVPWRINCFAEIAGKVSLQDSEYLTESIANIEIERIFLEKKLNEISALKLFSSTVNFIFFSCSSPKNIQKELLEKGILIRDCSNYKGLSGNYYRIAVRSHTENEMLIKVFEEYFNGGNYS